MAKYIDVEPIIKGGWQLQRYNSGDGYVNQERASLKDIPPADVVPWSFLERYADWFCELVPYPEFIQEAKQFYLDSIGAMEGGVIDDEYIKKQVAIDAVDSVPAADWIRKRYTGELERILPADVRPVVRGEWKHLGGDEWCCDQCGHVISTEGSWEHPLNDRSIYFCPNCGADMRGGMDG